MSFLMQWVYSTPCGGRRGIDVINSRENSLATVIWTISRPDLPICSDRNGSGVMVAGVAATKGVQDFCRTGAAAGWLLPSARKTGLKVCSFVSARGCPERRREERHWANG